MRGAGLIVGVAVVALGSYVALVRRGHAFLLDEGRFVIPDDSLTVRDRHGDVLRQVRGRGPDRRWVPIERVDRDFLDAVVAAEDQRFWEHDGVDLTSTLRALGQDLVPGGRRSGASTIAQQVVKLVYGRPHGALSKGLEVLRALELVARFDRHEVLEQYVNRVPYPQSIEGVERASQAYFGRPAGDLSLAEAALLAGLPRAPSRLDPRRHLDDALARRDWILGRMEVLGMRSSSEVRAARAERPAFVESSPRAYRAPRFVDAVVRRVRSHDVRPIDGSVVSTLDLALQSDVEAMLRASLEELAPRGATNASAIVIEHATGAVRAYVGAARSGPDAEGGELDLLRARRQPGSTLKPFVYAFFFERGGSPASNVHDVQTPMTGRGGALFDAEDFDGLERGPVSARRALAASWNLAALDVARRVGAENVVAGLHRVGIARGHDVHELGAAVVLGGADVTAIELATAYTALARGGVPVALRTEESAPVREGPRAIDAAAARLVEDVMADASARRAGFGRDLRELGGEGIALKTGTSQGFRDAWTAAFDARHVVVVWVGDPSGRPMRGVTGFSGAAPTAVRIVARARSISDAPSLAEAPRGHEHAVASPSLERANVCALSGLRPGAGCTHVVSEVFAPGSVPSRSCDVHAPDGRLRVEPRLAAWASRHPGEPVVVASAPSTHRALEPLRVTHPTDGSVLVVPPGADLPLPLRAARGHALLADVAFEVDGRLAAAGAWHTTPGHHVVVARLGRERSEPVAFEVRRQ